jgi:hypothetical protein
MINRKRDSPFGLIAHRYWERLVDRILVTEHGYEPSEGEVLSAYNDLKERHPECECIVLRTGKSSGEFFQQGDKIGGIRIKMDFDSEGSSVEFILTSDYYVRFTLGGWLIPYIKTATRCDLTRTMQNLEEFIEKYPQNREKLEQKKLEFEKRKKLDEITKNTIRACVSQAMTPMGRNWELTERGRLFLLRIGMGGEKVVEVTMDRRNFAKRISELPKMIEQVETLFKALPFPVEISMKK